VPDSPVTALLDALAGGGARVVDLTQPLSERTPVLRLPEPFANTPHLSRRDLSRYDDAGPAWAWSVLELGEHTGTHFDAPIHWITGRDREDVASVPPGRLVGPAVVLDLTAEVAQDPGALLTVAHLEAFEAQHGRIPEGAWVLLRTGWDARADDEEAFLNAGPDGPVTPGPDVAASRWLSEERGIVGFHELRGRQAGARRHIDLHVQFRAGTTLEDAHRTAHELQDAISQRLGGEADVLIHLEPHHRVRPGQQVAHHAPTGG